MRHNYYYFLIPFLFAGTARLDAQWLPSPAPPGEDIEHLFFADNLTGYLCAHGYVFKTSDGGQTWSTVYKPGDINGFEIYFFRGLHFTSPSTGYVIGQDFTNLDYLIMRTTNGGQTWLPYTYDPGFNIGECLDIDFASATNGFACGANGHFFKTIDGGVDWTPSVIMAALGQNLTCVDFVSAFSGFVLSDAQKLFKTVNGGQTWSSIALAYDLDKIQFFDGLNGLASGYNGLYKTTDGGLTWNHIGENFPNGIGSMHFIDANIGFGFVGGSISKTIDGGLHWHVQQVDTGLPANVNAGLTGLFSVDGQTGWACGYKEINNNLQALMVKTSNGGGLSVHLSLSDNVLDCPNGSVTATPSFLGTPGAVSWYLEGNLYSNNPGPQTFDFSQTGTYDIRVEASTGTNAVAAEKSVTVNGSFGYPGVTFSIPYQPCQREKGRVNTNWPTNWGKLVIYNGATFIDTVKIIISPTQGKYFEVPGMMDPTTLSFKAVDQVCHADVELGSVTFQPKTLPLDSFTLSTPSPVYCKALQVIDITQNGSEAGVSYTLYKEGQQVDSESGANGNPFSFHVSSKLDKPTRFWVRAYKSSNQCSAFLQDTFLLPIDLTDAEFTLDAINHSVGEPVQVTFWGLPAAQYDWSFGNQANPASSNVVHPGPVQYNGAINTEIRLITTGPFGCRDTVVRSVARFEPDAPKEYWAMEMDNKIYPANRFILVDSAGGPLVSVDSWNDLLPVSSMDGAGSYLGSNASFIKYDKHGILRWQIQHLGEHMDLRGLQLDHEGNIIGVFQVGGFEQGARYYLGSTGQRYPIYAQEKCVLAKWDPKGKFLWKAEVKACSEGGMLAHDLTIDKDNNILVFSSIHSLPVACNYKITFLNSDSSQTQYTNPPQYFVTSFSPAGKYQSLFQLQTTSGLGLDAQKIEVDQDGNVYVAAYKDNLLYKFTKQGDLVWLLAPDLIVPVSNCIVRSMVLDNQGNIYLNGTFTNTMQFGALSITSTTSQVDVFLMKVSPSGQVLWLQAAVGNEFLDAGKLMVHNKNLYTEIDFKHVLQYQSLTALMNIQLTSNRGSAWLNLSAQTGDLKSYKILNKANPSIANYSAYIGNGYGMDTDGDGNLYLSGRNGYQAFWADTLLQSIGYSFLTRIPGFTDVVGAKEPIGPEGSLDASISPNPSTQGAALLELHLKEAGRVRGKLVDLQGREQLLFDRELPEGSAAILLDTPPPGIYFLCIQTERGETHSLKWVVVAP